MGASNAIGTGAVVLTANADQLVSGLKGAEQKTQGWASRTSARMNTILTQNPISRALFGLPEFDAESGKYLGRVGGLLGKVKSLFGKEGGEKGKGGGLLGAMIFGGAAGAAAGLAFGAAKKGLDLIFGLPDMLKGLQESSGQGNAGPLQGIIDSLEKFQEIGANLLATVISPLAPAFERAAEIAGGFFDRLQPIAAALSQRIGGNVASLVEMTGAWLNVFLTGLEGVWPLIDKVTRLAEVLLFVFSELFSAVADGAAMAIKWIGDWVGSWVDMEKVSLTVSQAVFKGLKYVAMGAGYAWDAIKVGAGVVATVCGSIVQSFGAVLDVIAAATRQLAMLAAELPESIRPEWVGKAADTLAGWKKDVTDIGEGMKKWGAAAGEGFGRSAIAFGEIIDGMQARFDARAAKLADSAHKKGDSLPSSMADVKLVGAYGPNDREAYSITTRFQVGTQFAAALNREKKPEEKQLDAQKQGNKLLQQILRALGSKPVIVPANL